VHLAVTQRTSQRSKLPQQTALLLTVTASLTKLVVTLPHSGMMLALVN
jgi:hypothetical protein